MSDLTAWTEDEVAASGVAQVFRRNLISTSDLGLEESISNLLQRANDETYEKAERETARNKLARVHSAIITLMRVESGLDYTDETDPTKWPQVEQVRPRWGNDFSPSANPKNQSGEKNTTDARPAWWYRMVLHPANRDTILKLTTFWNQDRVEERRLPKLLESPKRKRALEALKHLTNKNDEDFAEKPKRGRKKAAANS